MDLRRVLLEGVFNFSLAVLGGLVGLTQTFGDTMGFDPFRTTASGRACSPPARRSATSCAAMPLSPRLPAPSVLILIGLGTGILRTLLRDYGFRLDRTANGLRRRRGLLTVTDVVLPAKRTQAAVIATGPVRDRFGWSELKFQSLAKEDGGKGDHVVAPLADDDEIGTVLAAIGWQPPQATGMAAGVAGLCLGLPVRLAAGGAGRRASCSILAPLQGDLARRRRSPLVVATRWLAWRRYAYALDGDRLLVRSGWWRRRIKILPIRNIQSVDYVQIFVDRWFGTADLAIGVAGGGLTGHGIKALPAKTAREIREQLLSRFA